MRYGRDIISLTRGGFRERFSLKAGDFSGLWVCCFRDRVLLEGSERARTHLLSIFYFLFFIFFYPDLFNVWIYIFKEGSSDLKFQIANDRK